MKEKWWKQNLPTCATSIWERTLLAASFPLFRFFISSKLISWLVNSDCIFCWKTKTEISKVWGKIVCCFNYLDELILKHIDQQSGKWPCPSGGPESGVLCAASQCKRNVEVLAQPQQKVAKMMKGLNVDFFFFSLKENNVFHW